ncbi:RHS repeat-associated core domain-containing protein, partial [Halomonas sp. V046]|uniref:RHS repeat-associated core domain-containing protein n=1 Tax=Halomonas sp. V046 TaxID=3459611 RepID=UPI0040446C9D
SPAMGNLLKRYAGTHYHYDAFGNLTRRIAPNGHTWHYQYNAEHRLTEASLYHQAPAAGDDAVPVTQAQYAYDGLGRRIYKRVKAPGAADRLTVFTWDGDLLQSEESFLGTLPPTPYFYSPSEHSELTRENPGRKHSIPIAQRQHSLATTPGITPERRVSYLFEPGSFIPAAKLEAHYKAIEQKTGSGTVLYTDHQLAEQTLYYFQTDHLGTPLELAGSDGNLAWIGQYRAWGKLTKATDGNGDPNTTDNPFRFQGQYHDEETGLHYNRLRYYDPEIGRFTTQDPIGLMGGANLYMYAPNPTGWVDPLGLSSCSTTPPADEGFFSGIWRSSTSWHFENRACNNSNLPTYREAVGRNSQWQKLPESQAIFHDNGIGKPEVKFIHPDGREVIFDGDTHEIVTNDKYIGTYNYVNPAPLPTSIGEIPNFIEKGGAHLILDVVPYAIGGNVRGPN